MSKNSSMGIRKRIVGRQNISRSCGIQPLFGLKSFLQSGILPVEIITRTLMLHWRSLNKLHSVDIEEVDCYVSGIKRERT